MQALADLAEQMRRWVRPLLAELTRTGTHAMRSRGRKLLAAWSSPVSPGDRLAESAVA